MMHGAEHKSSGRGYPEQKESSVTFSENDDTVFVDPPMPPSSGLAGSLAQATYKYSDFLKEHADAWRVQVF